MEHHKCEHGTMTENGGSWATTDELMFDWPSAPFGCCSEQQMSHVLVTSHRKTINLDWGRKLLHVTLDASSRTLEKATKRFGRQRVEDDGATALGCPYRTEPALFEMEEGEWVYNLNGQDVTQSEEQRKAIDLGTASVPPLPPPVHCGKVDCEVLETVEPCISSTSTAEVPNDAEEDLLQDEDLECYAELECAKLSLKQKMIYVSLFMLYFGVSDAMSKFMDDLCLVVTGDKPQPEKQKPKKRHVLAEEGNADEPQNDIE
ncbi:hypothetical protein Aduo_005992 [Ancylostoma duodenale]